MHPSSDGRSIVARTAALAAILARAATFAALLAPSVLRAQALDFSGVLYANYQQRTDSAARALNAGKPASKFDVERVYLTFRTNAGDRASVRLTTDIFNGDQSSASYYKGWTVRLKYAYLQWNFANDIGGAAGFNGAARFGIIQNVITDHVETFWPRYLNQTPEERTGGFFSSADLGAAVLLALPQKMGEIYGEVVNGPGYAAAEADRFKDVALRVSLTPLSASATLDSALTTLAISPWVYIGRTASRFQNGGAGQVGTVVEGLTRNRYGVFVGNRDRRLTLGAGYGRRTETVETGDNTPASLRATHDVTGQLVAAFAVARPGAWIHGSTSGASRWGLVGRLDSFKPDVDADPAAQFLVAGAFYDLTSRVTFALDAQQVSRKNGSTVTETKSLFLHVQAAF
jgi:hypothetical protein